MYVHTKTLVIWFFIVLPVDVFVLFLFLSNSFYFEPLRLHLDWRFRFHSVQCLVGLSRTLNAKYLELCTLLVASHECQIVCERFGMFMKDYQFLMAEKCRFLTKSSHVRFRKKCLTSFKLTKYSCVPCQIATNCSFHH